MAASALQLLVWTLGCIVTDILLMDGLMDLLVQVDRSTQWGANEGVMTIMGLYIVAVGTEVIGAWANPIQGLVYKSNYALLQRIPSTSMLKQNAVS